MKKRILGLALALIMIISLLPLTAFAAAPTTLKLYMYSPTRKDLESKPENQYLSQRVYYVTVVDNDATTDDLTDKKFAYPSPSTPPTDNYARYEYTLVDGVGHVHLELKNFDTTGIAQTDGGALFQIGYSTSDNYDTTITILGDNVLSGPWDNFLIKGTGNVLLTGGGNLYMKTSGASNDVFAISGAGDLTIRDVNITAIVDTAALASPGMANAFTVNGNITVENSTLTVSVNNGSALRTATARSSGLLAKEVTIRNSTIVATQASGQSALIANSTGTLNIENSSIELIGQANAAKVLNAAPNITGTYSSQTYSIREQGSAFEEKPYDATTAFESNIRYFKIVHECVGTADDGDCTTAVDCACGKEAVAAKTHIAGANADDCTKDTMCGNAGCTKVFEAKLGDTHTAGQDDGDCTTAVKCTNCEKDAIPAAANHAGGTATCTAKAVCSACGKEYGELAPHQPAAGTYSCDVAHPCANCTANYREAGQHIGGTATCQAKAKCTNCGAEYGELAACTPAADDGDCTTDIKCSLCGKTTTAGEAAHKYTDKNDTTCDNAGCTNTRKVEGTENPKTGDNTALVLMVTLMAVASAAFVTTKKFAR